MKRRRGPAWVRWTFVAVTVTLLAAYAASWRRQIDLSYSRGVRQVTLYSGALVVFHAGKRTFFAGAMPWHWWCTYGSTGGSSWVFTMPLWWLVALTGAGAAWAWSPGPPPPHACSKCGYDRSGLAASAPCPECGAPQPEAPRATG